MVAGLAPAGAFHLILREMVMMSPKSTLSWSLHLVVALSESIVPYDSLGSDEVCPCQFESSKCRLEVQRTQTVDPSPLFVD